MPNVVESVQNEECGRHKPLDVEIGIVVVVVVVVVVVAVVVVLLLLLLQ